MGLPGNGVPGDDPVEERGELQGRDRDTPRAGLEARQAARGTRVRAVMLRCKLVSVPASARCLGMYFDCTDRWHRDALAFFRPCGSKLKAIQTIVSTAAGNLSAVETMV